jgi:hypothetical protein
VRANTIAEPNEQGGLRCYLINGVCHQAANRILHPAGITVRGARGYWLSVSLYGVYGRPIASHSRCSSPFLTHSQVSGDLSACMRTAAAHPSDSSDEATDIPYQRFLGESIALQQFLDQFDMASPFRLSLEFSLAPFEAMIRYRLGEGFVGSSTGRELMGVRAKFEIDRVPIEISVTSGVLEPALFVLRHNDLVRGFQRDIGHILDEERYRALLDLAKGELLVLGDSDIAREAYGGGFNDAGA